MSDAWSTPRPRTRFFLSVGWENKGPVLRDVRSLKAPLDLAWPFLQPKQDRERERRGEGGREKRGKVGRCRVTLISALTSNLDAVICNNYFPSVVNAAVLYFFYFYLVIGFWVPRMKENRRLWNMFGYMCICVCCREIVEEMGMDERGCT